MKKIKQISLWILSDALLVFGIVFLPSLFSVFCIISSIIFIPIEEWQSFLKKTFNKYIRTIFVAICIAFIIAEFPLTIVVTRIKELSDPLPVSSDFRIYYEEIPSPQNNTTSFDNSSSKKPLTSSSSAPASSNVENESSMPQSKPSSETDKTSEDEIPEFVYRTPSGKRYHYSPTCGGKNSYEISLEDAICEELTPCKRCVK